MFLKVLCYYKNHYAQTTIYGSKIYQLAITRYYQNIFTLPRALYSHMHFCNIPRKCVMPYKIIMILEIYTERWKRCYSVSQSLTLFIGIVTWGMGGLIFLAPALVKKIEIL